jgi:Cu/Ag efflux protein CusF
MPTTRKLFAFVAASTLTIGAAQAFASQQPAPSQPPAPAAQAQQQQARASTARGELVKVDADAKMITIKNAEGAEQQFAYNDKTEVQGAQDGVAGLATKAGTKVTVHYTEEGSTKLATRIAVQAPPQQ